MPTMPGGRPKLPEGEGLDDRILFAVRSDDKAAFEAEADYKGIPLSEWIRRTLLKAVKKSKKSSSRRG